MKSTMRRIGWAGSTLILLVAAAIYFSASDPQGDGASGVVRIHSHPGAASAPARSSEPVPVKPSAAVKAALELTDAAVLRQPIPADLAGGIVCGEVSPSGNRRDYRRFVYNGAGATGAVDDGTDVFRKFADKICQLQPKD